MAKKKRMYSTSPHNSGKIKSMTVKDVDNPFFYTRYDLSFARFFANGALSIHCSGVRWGTKAKETVIHWTGFRTLEPDDPEYAKFRDAVKSAKQ